MQRIFFTHLLIVFLSLSQSSYSFEFVDKINDYFSQLEKDAFEITQATVVKKSKFSQTDKYFIRVLRHHQTMYKIIRTNSKGVVINEVIRGETPARTFRNLSRQRWYRNVSQTLKPYYSYEKNSETGRYYLFWAFPVLLHHKRRSRFIGAIGIKYDIWDCFHKLSDLTTLPFLIKINKKTLFSHKWNAEYHYNQIPLSVKGIDPLTISILDTSDIQERKESDESTPPDSSTSHTSIPETVYIIDDNTPSANSVSFPLLLILWIMSALVIGFLGLLFGIRWRYHKVSKHH